MLVDKEKERYVLLAVSTGDGGDADMSLGELAELLETAGGEAVAKVVQNLAHPDPATYVGSGKVYEVAELVEDFEADGILCDDELSPVQLKNLAEMAECKVIDRTMLILDIFAAHAHTKEGKIQVEMAQLKYRQAHLRGIGKALSRLGGGIGTRGPGETKLETDRRAIQRKIATLSAEIRTMKNVRATTRKKRQEALLPTVAIVGYTNAGKSTLLNRLTGAEVLAEDKLFATLDPTTRVCRFEDGQEVLFTDTVGFINKLPHHLVDAFRSTLEEVRYADYVLHVVDGADANAGTHMDVVYRTLAELDVTEKPSVAVFNKCDLPGFDGTLRDGRAVKNVRISAANGTGVDDLKDALSALIREGSIYVDRLFSYAEAAKLAAIRKYGQLIKEEYEGDGVRVVAYVPPNIVGKL